MYLNAKVSMSTLLNHGKNKIYFRFTRQNPESAYHDEVGIGGTINHVTHEYIHEIDPMYMNKSEQFSDEINHKLIKIFTNVLIPSISDYKRKLEQVSFSFKLSNREETCHPIFLKI
jgi:hypothetical protein